MCAGWGLDITGVHSGYGGPGGLLQIADHASGKTFLPAYDGNGNVVALVNGSTGALAAAYEYSPFGEFLRAESPDPVVADQPFRFSTKFYDGETGLYYYGFRYYSASQGRFLGRDPIEEAGGLNLYGFCGNNPISWWDILGLNGITVTDQGTFRASYTDLLGKLREWTFSSRTDAENWLQAWDDGNIHLLQPYLERMAVNEVAARAATLAGDPIKATIYLQSFAPSALRLIFGGQDDVSDDDLAGSLISGYGSTNVIEIIFGTRTPVIQAKSLIFLAGADSSVAGGLTGSTRDALVTNVKHIERFLDETESWHIQLFLLVSKNTLTAPAQYAFRSLPQADGSNGPLRSVAAERAFGQLLGGASRVVPLVVTDRRISTPNHPTGFGVGGIGVPGVGALLTLSSLMDNPFLVAHEVGHVGGYTNYRVPAGADRNHAPALEINNIMNANYFRNAGNPLLRYIDGYWLTAINKLASPVPAPRP